MRHRHWFLIFSAAALFFGFVFIRIGFFPYANYGASDISAAVILAVASALIWLVLEVTHHVLARRPNRCACGQSLAGLKCPECGKPQA